MCSVYVPFSKCKELTQCVLCRYASVENLYPEPVIGSTEKQPLLETPGEVSLWIEDMSVCMYMSVSMWMYLYKFLH